MASIFHKLLSLPKRKSNRQSLADLLNEYPIDKQHKTFNSLSNIKSPVETPTKPLLITSSFHQYEESIASIESNIKPQHIHRRPTPYFYNTQAEDKQDKQKMEDLNKKEIEQLRKIVKRQRKELDYSYYLLSRSSEHYYSYSYNNNNNGDSYQYYHDQDDHQYYSKDDFTSYAIPITHKNRKEGYKRSNSLPDLYDKRDIKLYSSSLPNINISSSVPAINNRCIQESNNSTSTIYKQQHNKKESINSSSVPKMSGRYSKENVYHQEVPVPYNHQRQENTFNHSYNNYAYSYQYPPIPYYHQSNSSSSSVPTYYYLSSSPYRF